MKKIILFVLVTITSMQADIIDIIVIKEPNKITMKQKVNNKSVGLGVSNYVSKQNKIITVNLNQKNFFFQHVKNIHKYKHFKTLAINENNQINDYELVKDKLKLYVPQKEAFLRIKVKATPDDKRFSQD